MMDDHLYGSKNNDTRHVFEHQFLHPKVWAMSVEAEAFFSLA